MTRKIALLAALSASACMFLGSTVAHAYEAGEWLVRGRIINVNPNEHSSAVSVGSPLAAVPGSGVGVRSDTVLELDITYMITKNWGAELILGTSQHDVPAEGSIRALGDIIDAEALPPTLTLQYHFRPDAKFRPYAGIGINYTKFFDEEVTGGLDAPGAKVDMEDSWGLAAQVGFDYEINKDWFFNADVKYIQMDTTAKFKNTIVGNAEVDVDIDPVIFGIGVGRRFW